MSSPSFVKCSPQGGAVPKTKQFKPLKNFNYKLVEEKLEGLLVNIDRDLQKRISTAEAISNLENARCLCLLNVLVRFTRNSYHAMQFLVADTPDDPARKPNYCLAVVPVNRQLLDLLFSLVYMLDDFKSRSLQYQRAGWREAREEYQKFKTEFSSSPEWKEYLIGFKGALEQWSRMFHITTEQQRNLGLIPYWKHPGELKDKNTASKTFLRWLDKWLYADTSAHSHLSFGGLIVAAPFLVAELAGGQDQEIVEGRMIQQFRFHQFSRTAFVTLAIATEIDIYCDLGNRDTASYLWTIFREYAPEANEMFNMRYKKLLDSRSAA